MQRPCFLNADSVGSLTYSKGLAAASALFFQDNAFKHLNSLTVSLFDLSVYLNRISYVKLGNFRF